MSLSNKEVKHVADLARIILNSEEEEKLRKDLSSILDYVDKLNSVNTDGIEPLYQITGLVNSIRQDEYQKDFIMDGELNNKLVGQAPHKENRFIKVRSVLSHK